MTHFSKLTPAGLSELDLDLLRQSVRLSEESPERGRHPFTELVAPALAARQLSPEELADCTLYTSAEPCCICSGAIYWTGIGRVVYALSEHSLIGLTGAHPDNPTFSLPCREVFARGTVRCWRKKPRRPMRDFGNERRPVHTCHRYRQRARGAGTRPEHRAAGWPRDPARPHR